MRSRLAVVGLLAAALLAEAHSLRTTRTGEAMARDPPSTFTLQGNTPIRTNTETQRLVDEHGREVYFHGVNVVVKGDPWIPETETFDVKNSFSDKDMASLQALGLNGIRLGTMWPGAEPAKGQYNMTYINKLMNITTKAASEYGIYSLLDMHQDVLSQKFCGEGTPLWASLPNNGSSFPWPLGKPYTLDSDGVPVGGYDGEQCLSKTWSEYYPTYATGSAFQALYDNKDGLRDSWSDFWKTIATAAQSTGNAVLGFELINEPWAGDIEHDILRMIPGVADKKNLQPFYKVAADKIRGVDTSHIIFFEGVTWDWFKVGFTEVPGGPTWNNLSALSYHFYVPPDFSLEVQFDARKDDMKRLKTGGMLTEFSLGFKGCSGCGPDLQTQVMDTCDKYAQSWLGWSYKPYQGNRTGYGTIWNPNGTLNAVEAGKLSRTYARVVAGVQQTASWNATTSSYSVSYLTAADVTNTTTMIYLNEDMHYSGGFQVNVMTSTGSSVTATWHQVSKNHIAVVHTYSSSSFAEATITVQVLPASTTNNINVNL